MTPLVAVAACTRDQEKGQLRVPVGATQRRRPFGVMTVVHPCRHRPIEGDSVGATDRLGRVGTEAEAEGEREPRGPATGRRERRTREGLLGELGRRDLSEGLRDPALGVGVPLGRRVNWQGTVNGTPSMTWIHVEAFAGVGDSVGQCTSVHTPSMLSKQRLPADCLVQIVEPGEANTPKPQASHTLCPDLLLKVSWGQLAHVTIPTVENLPGGQAWQRLLPSGTWPGRQLMHCAAPAELNQPIEQRLQEAAAGVLAKWLAGHGMHCEAPVLGE